MALSPVRIISMVSTIITLALYFSLVSTGTQGAFAFGFYTTVTDTILLMILREGVMLTSSLKCARSKKTMMLSLGGGLLASIVAFVYSNLKFALIVGHDDLRSITVGSAGLMRAYLIVNLLGSGTMFAVSILHIAGTLKKVAAMKEAQKAKADGEKKPLTLDEQKAAEDEAKQEARSTKADLLRLMRQAWPERYLMATGIAALVLGSLSQLIVPKYFGMVIEILSSTRAGEISQDDASLQLKSIIIHLFLLFSVSCVTVTLRQWMFQLCGFRVVARLRCQTFNAVTIQEHAFFDSNRTGDLTSRLQSDISVLQSACTQDVCDLVREIVTILGIGVMLFHTSYVLTLVMMAIVPVMSIGLVLYGGWVKKMRKKYQKQIGTANSTAEEVISNIRTVRAFSRETASHQEYNRALSAGFQSAKKLSFASGIFRGALVFTPQCAIALVLWMGGVLVLDNRMTLGELTAFNLYTITLAFQVAALSGVYSNFMSAVGAAARVFELLDRDPAIPYEGGAELSTTSKEGGAEVQLANVDFHYPMRPDTKVLDNFTLNVPRGKMTALVGPSGGGKSTIVSLVERFYDPAAGSIKIDGMDVRELDLKSLRRKVALVSQEPVLFATSIRDNICFGAHQILVREDRPLDPCTDPGLVFEKFSLSPQNPISQEEVERAAKLANAHDFIMSFDDGYDTMVGERGVRLSGGQKQRIAIARAMVLDPVLLLLDEATSALDAESESVVQEALDKSVKGRTTLVIAHRLSTIRNADQVAVLAEGKLAELGTHSDLIAKGGVYKKLVEHQLNPPGTKGEGPSGAQGNSGSVLAEASLE